MVASSINNPYMNKDFVSLRSQLSLLYSAGEANAISFLVFEEAFGVSRTDIYVDKVRHFSEDERERLLNMSKQLSEGVPVQYVLGKSMFCDHLFRVSPSVLIPRPETEELVAWAIDEAQRMNVAADGLRILDAGTGSGCIAISVQLALPQCHVSAWDISDDALAIARSNAQALHAPVTFQHVDMLQPMAETSSYHIIVSNPPYICQSEETEMEPNVLEHEPHTALFVPNADPLRFYRALCQHAVRMLVPGGSLMVEINRAYGRQTAALFRSYGLCDITLRKDAFGNDRMLLGRYQPSVK